MAESKVPARFALVEARQGSDLADCCFGVTLQPRNAVVAPPAHATARRHDHRAPRPDPCPRRAPGAGTCRRQRIAQTMHNMLLQGRPEERATLTVLPTALPAQRAYTKWGMAHRGTEAQPAPRLSMCWSRNWAGIPGTDLKAVDLLNAVHLPSQNECLALFPVPASCGVPYPSGSLALGQPDTRRNLAQMVVGELVTVTTQLPCWGSQSLSKQAGQ